MSDYRDIELSLDVAEPLDISISDTNIPVGLDVSDPGGNVEISMNDALPLDILVQENDMLIELGIYSGGGGGPTIRVIDNLDSDSSVDALAARQGKVLKNMIPDDEQIHFGTIDAMFAAVFGI